MQASTLYRAGVAARLLAAIAGGYALTAIATSLLAVLLPASRVNAVMTATLLSFVFYAFAIMWAFAARSAWRAWAGLLLPAALLGCALWLCRGSAA